MKSYKSITVTFVLLLIFSLVFMSRLAECTGKETSLIKILSDASIQATTYWNFGHDIFLVVVSSYIKRLEDAQLTGRKLTVYKKQNMGFLKAFEYDAAMDNFVGMFQLGDNSNTLMTIWIGGSAYHFKVFNISAGKVFLALQSSSHNYPELVDLDNDGTEEILISKGTLLVDAKDKKVLRFPQKTDLYKWDGKNYVLIKTVSWKNRLDALKWENK